MEDTLIYNYPRASSLVKREALEELFLAKYSEIHKNTDVPCFFWECRTTIYSGQMPDYPFQYCKVQLQPVSVSDDVA